MRLARSATDGGVTLDQGEPGPGCQLLGPSHNVHILDTRHPAPGVRVPAPVRMIMVIVTWSALKLGLTNINQTLEILFI